MSNIRDSLKPYFEGFDELREELGETLKGWDTPVVVVFGPQNAGKSTLLERLAMMSLFPKGEGLCTRVPVRIRLRTGDARPPLLSVWARGQEGEQKLDERAVSAQGISNEITQHMTRLVSQTHAGGRAVRADRLIQVESWGPDLPNLDLVDLPGMVVAGRGEDAPNLPEQTYDLTLQMIDELKERAIFLAVREASQDVEQSLTTKVLAARPEIRDRCMGALTKCDKSLDETVQEQLAASAEWSLSYGYVATMNKPEASQTLERLAAVEREWFSKAPARKALLDAGRAGCDQLVKKLTALYHDYLKRSWAPRTLARLAVAAQERAKAREELGPVVSTPPSPEHLKALERVTRQAAEAARERSVAGCVERVQGLSPWRAAGAPAWIAAAQERGAEDVTLDAAVFTREAFHPERGLEAWCLGLLEQVVRGFEGDLERELQGRLSRDRKGQAPWSELRVGRFPNLVARVVGEQRATVTPMCGRVRAQLAAWLGRCLEERVSFEGNSVVVRGGMRLLHGALVVLLREVGAWRWAPRWEELGAEAGLLLDEEREERARLLREEAGIEGTRVRLARLFPDVKGEAPVVSSQSVGAPRPGEVRCFQARGAPDVSMVFCPAGEFEMGSASWTTSQPIHRVKLTRGFWMGQAQVTQELWQAVMGSNPSHFSGRPKHPVEQVSWHDAVQLCNKLSALYKLQPAYTINGQWVLLDVSKSGYRLPTEAEWEYAARAGQGFEYAGSGDVSAVAWFKGNSGSSTQPVMMKAPNAWGLYDMSGNVWEWCSDGWMDNYSARTQGVSDPLDNSPGAGGRVLRGGSWYNDADFCRVAYRSNGAPDFRSQSLGLRLSRSLV